MATANKIFPYELMEHSVEKYYHVSGGNTRRLYLMLLLLLLVAFLSLFFIKVDISVKSTGILKSVQERTDIKSAIEGVVDSIYISENMHVVAGQPLLKVNSKGVDEKHLAIQSQQTEISSQLKDLEKLTIGKSDSLSSILYAQEYALYKQKLSDVQVRYDLVNKNYNRYQSLYKSKVISAAEFDRYDYERKAVLSELNLVKEQQMGQWKAALTQLRQQATQVNASNELYEQQQSLFVIKAPVTGTVQNLKGIQPASFVSPGEVLAEISPDSGIIAETYVLPKDIAYLHTGTAVRMQVDAFDYNLWGMVTGKVLSISKDVFVENGQTFFKVRCRVDNPTLQLKNGFKGTVKKGMNVQARFLVTKRTLFQLLYDKADDWLNPNS